MPFFEKEIPDIPGLRYIPNFLSSYECSVILSKVDKGDWSDELKRRVQHYGYKYDYKNRSVNASERLGPLPIFLRTCQIRLVQRAIFTQSPDQCIVNEYQPGQGIGMHVDCEPCFGKTIVTVSLGSEYTMMFMENETGKMRELDLEIGSLLILSDEARYNWKHGIVARKFDGSRKRGRRVSLTFRKVIV